MDTANKVAALKLDVMTAVQATIMSSASIHDVENWVRFIFHVTWKCCNKKVHGMFASGFWPAYYTFKQVCI